MAPELLISLTSLAVATIVATGGYLAYRDNSKRKAFAAEREFGHIKNSQAQILESLRSLYVEVDEVVKELIQIKVLLGYQISRKRDDAE